MAFTLYYGLFLLFILFLDIHSLHINRYQYTMHNDESQDISFFFVLGELIASFIVIFLSFGPLIFKVSKRIPRSNSFKDSMIYLAVLAFWTATFFKAVIKLTVWTNIWISVTSCDPFCKSTVILNIPCLAGTMYCIVAKFENKRTMQWISLLFSIFIAIKLFSYIWTLFTAEGFTRNISGVGIKGKMACSRREGVTVEGQQQQIISIIYCAVHFVVAMSLSGMFLRKIYSVVSKANLNSFASPRKFKRMEKAMHKVIRHCILSTLLAVGLIIQPILQICGFIDFASSLWINLFGGFVLFWYFPFADAHYQRYFGWIQRRIFAKWFISKVEDPSKFLVMLQSQHRDRTEIKGPADSDITENEANDNPHVHVDGTEVAVTDITTTITMLSTMSLADDEDQNRDPHSLLSIDFKYLEPFQDVMDMMIVAEKGPQFAENENVQEQIKETSNWRDFMHLMSAPHGGPQSISFR